MKRSRVDLMPRKKSSPGKIKQLLLPEDIVLKKGPSKLCLKKIKIKTWEGNKSKEFKKKIEIIKTAKQAQPKVSGTRKP